jgi:ribosomal protein L11 methyltransferase
MNHDNPHTSASATQFFEIRVRTVDAGGAARISAEAWAAGATGIEERDAGEALELLIYAPSAAIALVRSAVANAEGAMAVSAAEAVDDTDWSEQWKHGLRVIDVSPRLQVRPSFVAATVAPGTHELVIDPGQAFGTGGHESTRLTLEWIDQLAPEIPPGSRALDVGTGTGVLALAAIQLAGVRVVAFDADPLAASAARINSIRNGLQHGIDLFTGTLAAVGAVQFQLILANLLKNEMLPLSRDLAEKTARGGRAVFSGLLAQEVPEATAALGAAGFVLVGAREATDANGDRWTALLMRV